MSQSSTARLFSSNRATTHGCASIVRECARHRWLTPLRPHISCDLEQERLQTFRLLYCAVPLNGIADIPERKLRETLVTT
jgi:hypothetical protein